MTPHEINNYFGDMDIFLMDLILKGKISEKAKVLDAGCGEGRNGIYFINRGYDYVGIDTDRSKVSLIDFLSKGANASFFIEDIKTFAERGETFDFIICSRVLHFAHSVEHFMEIWSDLVSMLNEKGIIYISMDSVIDTDMGVKTDNGRYQFPDNEVRFAITTDIYKKIKKGFEEIESLKTLVAHNKRAQSFIALQKTSPCGDL
jgi:tellurite methyltransferase